MELIKTEKQEHSIVELTIAVSKEEFEKAKDKAYKKQRSKIVIPGFRRGKAPRKMLERLYGDGMFFEDAVNIVYPDAVDKALEESGLEPVGKTSGGLGDPQEEGGVTLVVKVPVMPEVTLGQYKGLEVEKEEYEVTDDMVNAELDRMAKSNARTETVDREAKEGDTVDLDFEGFIDGAAFDGGRGEHQMLTLGSGSFIPGFEDQLVGCKAGDEKDVVVTFPEAYHAKELSGKEAVFKCKVHKVEETILPELDDEFAKDVSDTCDTLDELKNEIRQSLKKEREEAAEQLFENKVIEAAVENMTADIPEAMYEAQLERDMQEFVYRLNSRGMELNRYLEMSGINLEQMRNMMRPQAVSSVKGRLMLEKVAELENVGVTEQELAEEYDKLAEQYGMELDRVKELITESVLSEDLKVSNALKLLTESAVAVPAKKNEEEG